MTKKRREELKMQDLFSIISILNDALTISLIRKDKVLVKKLTKQLEEAMEVYMEVTK